MGADGKRAQSEGRRSAVGKGSLTESCRPVTKRGRTCRYASLTDHGTVNRTDLPAKDAALEPVSETVVGVEETTSFKSSSSPETDISVCRSDTRRETILRWLPG